MADKKKPTLDINDCVQFFPDSKYGIASVHAFDNSKLSREQAEHLSGLLFDERPKEVAKSVNEVLEADG